jgi:hypothetical protein
VVGRAKVAARRYLSEFRDSYLARNDLVLKAVRGQTLIEVISPAIALVAAFPLPV